MYAGQGDSRKRYRSDGGYRGGGKRYQGTYGEDGNGRFGDKRAEQPPQPRHGGQKKLKTKGDEIRDQIKALLVRVGDFHHISTTLSSLEENIEGLASPLGDELGTYGDFIVDFILTASAQLSMQTPVYGTLVGLLNARDEDFGAKLVKGVVHRLEEMIRLGRWVNAKLLLRLLAELANARVVKPEGEGSLGELLKLLLGPVLHSKVPPARKDLYAHMLLSVLPWAWEGLAKEWPDGLPELAKALLNYADRRMPTYTKGGLRTVLEGSLEDAEDEGRAVVKREKGERETNGEVAPTGEAEPVLDSVQTAAKVVRELLIGLDKGNEIGQDINAIVKPWRSARGELTQGIRHPLPVLTLPDPDPSCDSQAPLPLPFSPIFAEFDLFDEATGGRAASLGRLPYTERWVLKEYLKDILVTFRPFVSEGGNKRGSFVAESEQLFSIVYLAPPDIATELLASEVMLLWLLQRPGRDLAYTQRLLVQVVLTPKSAAALALGVHILFQDYLEILDHGAISQLADWLGAHLCNTQFSFPYWGAWVEIVQEHAPLQESDHPQLFFLRRALDVAVRLTYVGKVREHIPEGLHALLPGQPYTVSPFLPPEAEDVDAPGDSMTTRTLKELVRRFKAVLQGHMGVAEVQLWLDMPFPEVEAERSKSDPLWRITLIAHAASRISDNTVAHLPSLLEKCLSWFRQLFDSDEHQLRLVEALAECWHQSPQMLQLSLNAFMRMHMILPVNLVSWLSRPSNARDFARRPVMGDLFDDAYGRSIEPVATYVAMIERAVGQHAHMSQGETREEQARHFAGAETLDHAVVAVENAQEVALEMLGGLVKVLNRPSDQEEEYCRAGRAYLRAMLQQYFKLQEEGLNTAVPGTDPIFELDKLEESLDMTSLVPELRKILKNARQFADGQQLFGGEQAHGQIFSTDE